MTARRDYGPIQLATFLGLAQWQLDRALAAELIPGPDTPRGRWSAAVASDALSRIEEIRAEVGSIPDLGAVRAAEVLTGRLGVEVTGDGVAELARRALLPITGDYKGWPLYDGRAWRRSPTPPPRRRRPGPGGCAPPMSLPPTCASAARTSATWSAPGCLPRPTGDTARSTGATRSACRLYRTRDLDELAARPGIDWDAVRAIPAGHRSPLAALPGVPARTTR